MSQHDDAKGKRCDLCLQPMVDLASLNMRICSGCKTEWPWELKPGQLPLIASNRANRHGRV